MSVEPNEVRKEDQSRMGTRDSNKCSKQGVVASPKPTEAMAENTEYSMRQKEKVGMEKVKGMLATDSIRELNKCNKQGVVGSVELSEERGMEVEHANRQTNVVGMGNMK